MHSGTGLAMEKKIFLSESSYAAVWFWYTEQKTCKKCLFSKPYKHKLFVEIYNLQRHIQV